MPQWFLSLDSESQTLIIVGVCFVIAGVGLVLLAALWHHEYERIPGTHEAGPEQATEPADAPATLPAAAPSGRHRYEDLPGSQTTRLVPPDVPRGTVPVGGADDGKGQGQAQGREPEGVHRAGPEARVREVEEAVREDDRGEDRERGDHAPRTLAYGEEGSAYAEAQRGAPVIAGWYRADSGEWFRVE